MRNALPFPRPSLRPGSSVSNVQRLLSGPPLPPSFSLSPSLSHTHTHSLSHCLSLSLSLTHTHTPFSPSLPCGRPCAGWTRSRATADKIPIRSISIRAVRSGRFDPSRSIWAVRSGPFAPQCALTPRLSPSLLAFLLAERGGGARLQEHASESRIKSI